MNKNERQLFYLLKQDIATVFFKEHSASSKIEEWKGEDIVTFQEDLFEKTKGRVSEKWFYTYVKNTPEKLPRIDILNLLSTYVGYENWHAYSTEHTKQFNTKWSFSKNKLWLLLSIPLVLAIYFSTRKNTFEFCFVDTVTNKTISKIPIDIKILKENESPLHLKTDSLGCFIYKTRGDVITFIAKSPYHKTDTIVRHINSNINRTVKLRPDDYALMLHYYTSGNIKDWKKHLSQLEHLIADDVQIYRFFENTINVELYTKGEFINLLTIPTKSLQRTEILDKTLRNGKIVVLKFIVK